MKLSFPTRRSFELASVTPRPIFSQRDLKEAVPSERLHYGENDDKRGQYARHLIQHPQFLVAEWPKPLCQLFRIANHPSMITGENRSEQHTSELQTLMRISYAVFYLQKKTKQ